MSNITILGATSATGKHLIPLLHERGHELTVLTRNDGLSDITTPSLRVLRGDATSTADVSRAVRDADVVIMMIGARTGQPAGTVRSDATKALTEALRQTNPDAHVIAVSALGGSASIDQLGVLGRFIYRKVVGSERLAEVDHQEQLLRSSGLTTTVVRPPKLDDKRGTGPKEASRRLPSTAVLHRADLAAHIAACVEERPSSTSFRTIVSS